MTRSPQSSLSSEGFDRLLPITLPQSPAAFSSTLCAATLLLTTAGLIAATYGIRWGAAAAGQQGDALRLSFHYVNLLWSLALLLFPPIKSLRPHLANLPLDARRAALWWDFTALLIGGLPAAAISAFAASTPPPIIAETLLLQLALSLFSLSLLRLTLARAQPLAAALLATLTTATPLLVYLAYDFLTHTWQPWMSFAPLIAATEDHPLLPALTYLGAALLLLLFPSRITTDN